MQRVFAKPVTYTYSYRIAIMHVANTVVLNSRDQQRMHGM